jgi:hypothetical protein
MKTKYYRFLYFGRKRCLLHVGEIEDTRNEDRLTFLYVGSCGRDDEFGRLVENKLSYPKRVDILIVGDTLKSTEEVVEELLKETVVDTVVYPQEEGLHLVLEGHNIRRKIGLGETGNQMEYGICRAGWSLRVACLDAGGVVLLHGLENQEMFDDCVMNVSVLDGDEHLGWWSEKDGFAAAMRCTVHHDYDACRYREDGDNGKYRVSTLLYGNTPLKLCRKWMQSLPGADESGNTGEFKKYGEFVNGNESRNEDESVNGSESRNNGKFVNGSGYKGDGESGIDRKSGLEAGLRFLSLPSAGKDAVWDEGILGEIPDGYKCYYIGSPGEPSVQAISQICRRSPYQVPVIAGEGTGLCCAGFLKYAE